LIFQDNSEFKNDSACLTSTDRSLTRGVMTYSVVGCGLEMLRGFVDTKKVSLRGTL
jgi:hypothetical protein